MIFGCTVAGDEFQQELDAVFSNIDFYIGIADDMIICREQPDGSDHDRHLTEFFQVIRNPSISLTISKFQCKTKHASFIGTTSHLMVTNLKMKKVLSHL